MDSVGAMLAAIIVAISLLAGAGVVQYSLSNSGTEHAYTEDFDPGVNQTTIALNESNRDGVYYDADVAVVDENDSAMRPGIDYQWHQNNGTLTVLDGGDLDNDATGTVEYSLRIPSQNQKNSASMLGEWLNASYAIPLIFVVGLVVVAVGVLGNLS